MEYIGKGTKIREIVEKGGQERTMYIYPDFFVTLQSVLDQKIMVVFGKRLPPLRNRRRLPEKDATHGADWI